MAPAFGSGDDEGGPPGSHGSGGTVASQSAESTTALLPSHHRRAEAFAIDALVVVAVFGLALALDKVTDLPGLGLAGAAGLVWVYYVGATVWLMEGQSAGKTICELRVVPLFADSVPGNLRGLLWSVGRHTVGYVVIDVFLLGTLLALVNRHRRCLHDYAFASQVTYVAGETDEEGRPLTLVARYRSYWERFAERYDELTKRNRWFFFPWKWLSKAVVIVALLLDKVLPAESAPSAGAVPAPAEPPAMLTAKAATGVWVGTVALSGLIAAMAWPEPDPSIPSLKVVTNFGTVGYPDTQEIFLMQANGSELRQLTRNGARDGAPDLFADRRVVFDSERDGNREIYVMQADGSDQTRLTFSDGHDGCPEWSPDGTRVAFTSDRDGNWNIYVMNADGSDPRRVTEDPADDWCPSWSPDGERVAFTSNRAGYWNIYSIRLDGSRTQQITSEPAADHAPAWSPDGSRMAFTSDRDGDKNIYLVDLENGTETQVTDHRARDSNPFWAPGGEKLLYGSGRDFDADQGGELYVTEPDGSGTTRLTFFADCWPDASSCDFTS